MLHYSFKMVWINSTPFLKMFYNFMKTGLFVIQNNFNEILILYSYISYIHQPENELIAAPFEGLFFKKPLGILCD